jgi:hypothetical protein
MPQDRAQRFKPVQLIQTCASLRVTAAAGALSIVEVSPKRVKLAAGAYVGTLEAPEQMAVFLYYLDVSVLQCPIMLRPDVQSQ